MGSRWLRNGFIYLLILVAVVAIVYSFFSRSEGLKTLEISQVVADARTPGTIDEIIVKGNTLTIKQGGEDLYKAQKEDDTSVLNLLREEGVEVGDCASCIKVQVKSGGA